MILVDGKKIAEHILAEVAEEVRGLPKRPLLVAVLVGEHAASLSYLKQKRKACERAGIDFKLYQYPENITTTKLRKKFAEIRKADKPTAIIVQLPLPPHINTAYILDAIRPEEDADVLSSKGLGLVLTGKPLVLPPTAASVLEVLRLHGVALKGKRVVLIGWGRLVGQPASILLLQNGAMLTVVTSPVTDLAAYTKDADIVISGAGKPNLVTGDMVKEEVIAIDVGFSRIGDAVVGDLDFESVSQKAGLITPVPGGIGPIAVAMLLKNVVALAQRKKHKTDSK